jgi:hypothetical protein
MAGINAAATRRNVTLVRLLWLSTFVLVLIGVAIVTRRVLILSGLVAPSPLSESAPVDAAFAPLEPEDLERLATAAYLMGRDAESEDC